MHVLIVDDEPLARSRLRLLLSDCQDPADPFVLSEAASASQAMHVLQHSSGAVDVVLLDIQLPGTSGMSLAHTLQQQAHPPLLIFVTAHSQYAAQAFDVQACDYLTKPVRLQRLQQALHKARQLRQLQPPRSTDANAACTAAVLAIPSANGHTERLPLAQVAYIQAELKALTVHTLTRSLLIDGSLLELEQRFGAQLLRCHRSYLVNPQHICALEKTHCPQEGEGWVLRLHSLPQALPVSRRQLPVVRAALSALPHRP